MLRGIIACIILFCFTVLSLHLSLSGFTFIQGGPKITGPFLRVYNFATVGVGNARDMSKFSKFYLEKNVKLACQCV